MKPWDHDILSKALRDWLNIATEDLCIQARSRVAVEIWAHFNESVATHVDDGKSTMEAQTLALEELGDARVAAGRLRKENLTLRECDFIQDEMRTMGKRETYLQNFLEFLVMGMILGGFWWFFGASRFFYFMVGSAVSFRLVNWICGHLIGWMTTTKAVKWISLIQVSSVVVTIIAGLIISWSDLGVFSGALCVCLRQGWNWWKVLRKLRDDRNFLTPAH